MELKRDILARAICERLDAHEQEIARGWEQSAPVRHFVVDDVLPVEWANQIRSVFPGGSSMELKKSWRELKYVAAQMNRYDPLLEESIFAFQMPNVVERVARMTGLKSLEPDEMLYAGGISLMAPGHFLNPHIDNSHDKFRQRYRALNLLYYVSPDWSAERGGNLELWPKGPQGEPITVVSRFNRLVVMLTHRNSWHSVSENRSQEDRCCVSNYYFSKRPLEVDDYYHVTEFRGRPEQPVRDAFLRADNWLRTMIRTKLPGAFKNPHYYDRKDGGGKDSSPR